MVMKVNKGKILYDSDSNAYKVVEISGRLVIFESYYPKEYVVTRPLRLDSDGLIILDGPGVWWCWSYGEALRLIKYIKNNG